jgi:hypothetical protein
VIPFGFELIERSITKQYPADLENVGALAIKRATASEVMFIEGEPLVDDVCLILSNDGEEVPEGYVSLERISNVKESLRSSKASQTAVKIVLAYHQRPAMGLCDLSYESATLDRYPQKVYITCFLLHCNKTCLYTCIFYCYLFNYSHFQLIDYIVLFTILGPN